MKKKRTGWIKHIDFLIVDLICQQLAFLFSGFLFCEDGNPYQSKAYLILALVFILLDIFVAFAFGFLPSSALPWVKPATTLLSFFQLY